MANEVVGIDIKADVRSLRTQIREATQEFARLQNTAGASSKEIADSAKRVAELKDRLADARSTIDAFNPDQKFKAFSQSIQGVAGAFASAQGALGLFGAESENLQKQLLKVQSALALSEGLNTVLDSVQGFKNLALVIKTNVIGAFTTLRGAIIATGIGALGVALAYVIGNFEKVKEVVLKVVPGLSKVGEVIGSIVENVTDFVGITSEADRALDKFSANSKNRRDTYENELKVMEAQGASEKALANKRKQIIQEDINLLVVKQKNGKQLTEEEVKQLRDSRNELLVIDAKYRKSVLDQQAKSQDEYNKKQEEETNKFVEQAKQRNEKINEIGLSFLDEQEQKLVKLADNYQKELELLGDNLEAKKLLQEKYSNDFMSIVKYENTNYVKSKEATNAKEFDYKLALINRIEKVNKDFAKRDVDISKVTTAAKVAIVGDAFGILSGMAEQGTALQKGLALAQVAIDTGVAISGLTASTSAPSPDNLATGGISGFAKYAAGIIKILANIAQAKNIISSASTSSSASSSTPNVETAAPIIPQFQQASTVNLSSETMNKMNNVAVRAYVVESDISNSQQRIKRLENSATF
jgi:hypothetical protein